MLKIVKCKFERDLNKVKFYSCHYYMPSVSPNNDV